MDKLDYCNGGSFAQAAPWEQEGSSQNSTSITHGHPRDPQALKASGLPIQARNTAVTRFSSGAIADWRLPSDTWHLAAPDNPTIVARMARATGALALDALAPKEIAQGLHPSGRKSGTHRSGDQHREHQDCQEHLEGHE